MARSYKSFHYTVPVPVFLLIAEEIHWAYSSFKNCIEVLELSHWRKWEQEREKNAWQEVLLFVGFFFQVSLYIYLHKMTSFVL